MKQNRRKKSPVSAGFTLLEVLVAFGILFSCLVLLAALFTRHLEVLQRMERACRAQALADQDLVREAMERHRDVLFPVDPPAGYSVQRRAELTRIEIDPSRGVELDQVTADAVWSFRGREYTQSLSAGFQRSPEAVE